MAMRFTGLAAWTVWRWLIRREGPERPDGLAEGSLTMWPEGEEAAVVELAGASRLASRLRVLGVVPGARVRVLRRGCPTVIQVEEGRFCLRREDASAIRVGPVVRGSVQPEADL